MLLLEKPPIPSELEVFKRAWTASLLNDQAMAYRVRSLPSRIPKNDLEDSLFSRSINTPDTINAAISLTTERPGHTNEMLFLVSLGQGVCGYDKIIHGGFSAMLVDEMCGIANAYYNNEDVVTASLTLNYRKPVPIPGVVLCKTRVTKAQGRKRFFTCTLEGPNEEIYVDSVALFVETRNESKL